MTSVRSRILDNIKTSLELIDGTGQYNLDITAAGGAQEWEADGVTLASLPACVFEWRTDQLRGEAAESPDGWEDRDLEVVVDGVLQTDASGGTSSAHQLEEFLEDIERALMVDRSRGGNAVDTHKEMTEPINAIAGQTNIGGHVRLRIHYMVRSDAPQTGPS